jgi:hypothetical protein
MIEAAIRFVLVVPVANGYSTKTARESAVNEAPNKSLRWLNILLGAEQAAKKLGILCAVGGKRPPGAKALFDSAELAAGRSRAHSKYPLTQRFLEASANYRNP